jgi:hypothetical protein
MDKKTTTSDISDFDELLRLVKEDAKLIDDLTDDQVTGLRQKINPYGRTIEGSGKLTCLSITNMSEQYTKKFLMTALIAFLYRQCDEYLLDDGEPVTHMDDFGAFMPKYKNVMNEAKASKAYLRKYTLNTEDTLDAGETLDAEGTLNTGDLTLAQKGEVLEHKKKIERGEGMSKRIIIRQFIDSLFQYNPDKHVRSAYCHNILDPERVVPSQVVTGTKPKKKANKRSKSQFVQHIPPADTFHRWSYYIDSNYEEIRTAVQDLYCDKPDIEFAINPYEQFSGESAVSDAEKFVQKHRNEVIADVLTLTNGKWNLCGSFKKNRERINFYNEKTGVIEELFKQMDQDKKLGADLMRKRVVRKKEKNIEECGPDPEEFKQYRKDFPSGIEQMGAESVSSDDVKKDNSILFKNHVECPYDAVQVDVFNFADGGATVKKSEFFTKAEVPEIPDVKS